jgi:hypothetical protein
MPYDSTWFRRAKCRDYPFPHKFFDMSEDYSADRAELQALCDACPVIANCRAYVDWIEKSKPKAQCHGFWAGETVKERLARRFRELFEQEGLAS